MRAGRCDESGLAGGRMGGRRTRLQSRRGRVTRTEETAGLRDDGSAARMTGAIRRSDTNVIGPTFGALLTLSLYFIASFFLLLPLPSLLFCLQIQGRPFSPTWTSSVQLRS